MKAARFQQDALRRAKMNIGINNRLRIAHKGDAAVGDLRDFITEVIDLILQNALHTEVAGSDQFVLLLLHADPSMIKYKNTPAGEQAPR